MKHQKKRLSLFLPLLLALTLLFPARTLPVQAESGTQDMAVHFLDVEQGLSILVQSGGENLLYDGGDTSHSDEVAEYLHNQNVENIDYMISSHYDADHLGGLLKCLQNFSVENILGADYYQGTDLYMDFVNAATANAISIQYPKPGDTFSFGTGSFTVLAPSGIDPNDSNENSVVIRLTNGNNSFLFTGDAEETSEQDMISTGRNLDCDVLSLGHHGSSSSTTWDFLEASTPSWAVISCGAENKYGHPSADTMGRLSSMNIPVFRTDKQGTVVALSDGENVSWNQAPCNDYSSGDSSSEISVPSSEDSSGSPGQPPSSSGSMVWIPATGEKYHSIPDCGRMNPAKASQITESEAISRGYGPCSKCF
ncbi:MAG: MBL fold metallo-hydrolase [Blautia sp.]